MVTVEPTRALLFPGQGSQHVGMAADLGTAGTRVHDTFAEADDILGFSLSRLMAEGPEEVLTETRNAQPAILTHSVAVHRALGERIGAPLVAAGHSLGEYSAYVAAGTLTFRDALLAVRRRGELMFAAGDARPGAMAAVLGLTHDAVRETLKAVTAGICVPANFNSPTQVVISGDRKAVEEAMAALDEAGARRVVPLPVSGAFHSPLMLPAAEELRTELEGTEFQDPAFPVVSNVTASPIVDGTRARELLARQLTAPVRWSESVETMLEAGTRSFVEIGPGRILGGINRQIARRVPCVSIGRFADLDKLKDEGA